jgi:cytochrome c oxidase subunit 2
MDVSAPKPSATRRHGAGLLSLLAGAFVLAGCGSRQNALAPQSHQARDIASLWWWMMGGSAVGFSVIAGILFFAWVRRGRRGIGRDDQGAKPGERVTTAIVLGLGFAVPIVVIATLFVVSDVFLIRTTQAPAAATTKLTVRVIGHQWFWEVRYPGTTAVTANEIHIPARTPVLVEATTADVIHSFWVPRLNRKIDMIPGRVNEIELYADAPGSYRGQCSEFCGLQHAHMAMVVDAQPPAQFRSWLAGMAKPAPPPATALERFGERVFLDGACSSCHTIRGTSASGDVGPDLTHLASRTTLGALTVSNTPEELASWITDSQHVKPGNQMPDVEIDPAQLRALVSYLNSLK